MVIRFDVTIPPLTGAKKRKALLEKFGTIDKIMSASEEELCEAEGIGGELAKKIHAYFKEQL